MTDSHGFNGLFQELHCDPYIHHVVFAGAAIDRQTRPSKAGPLLNIRTIMVVSRMSVGFFERDKALALYPTQQTIDQLIERDRRRFAVAVDQLGEAATGAQSEPVNAAAGRFNAELSAVRAAAEARLELGEFQRRLRSSGQLVATGFGQWLVADGGVKRDAWERSFGEVTRELGIGGPPRGPFTLVRSPVVPRVGADDVNPAVARSLASSTEPADLLRSAKNDLHPI